MPISGVWWENANTMYGIVEHTDGVNTWESRFSNEIPNIKEVVTIDGLFMAIDPDSLFYDFDESFKGFHFYDHSFCIPCYIDGLNIGVITSIRVLHKSVGFTNQQWRDNQAQFVEKYLDVLPISIPPIFKEITTKLIVEPKVSVIIPTKNNYELIFNNIESWKTNVKYKNYEIIIADTGSRGDVLEKYDNVIGDRVRLVKYDYYNFSKINNDVVKNHLSYDTELILFCNDDIELLNDALTRCVDIYQQNIDTVGTIGIRLHYGDSSVQHCGIEIIKGDGKDTTKDAIHLSHIDLKKTENYKTDVYYNCIGNTAAFLLINKNLFLELGCFNEEYIECFEDVELNLLCILKNKANITVCDAVAYHFESVSRNKNENKLKKNATDYYNNLFPFYKEHEDVLSKILIKN
jgi:GT2 family glycosyltransferase